MPMTVVLDTAPEHVAYALLGCFIIFFGLVSLFVKEKLFISEAFVATAFGIIIGPYAIGIFDPMSWKNFDGVTLEFTRIVIAVQVMAAGVSLPRSYMVKERRSLFMMIVPLMILMWLTSALLIWGLIPDLDFVESMVLAACVTPTDPVLSNSVVKGRFAEKHVPPRIRYLLSAESGINDGMGLPFLFLGLYIMRERSLGQAFAQWFYLVWAYQILLSIVLGGLIGAAARKLVKGAKNRNLIDKESFLVFSIALALAVSGCVSILASDDLLACFIAGNVFAWDDWFSNEIAEAHIQEIIDMLLNLACFVYIGASIPFSSFHDPALGLSIWRMIVLAILVLLFRRMPFVIALKPFIPALATRREAAFAGWFGPIGVGAVFFSKVTAGMTNPNNLGDNPHNVDRLLRVRSIIWPIVMFLVLSSVLIHGVTVPLLHLQYKYTRTWSRKREESSHVVTRLPHINIGDEIVLRPPTISGSSIGGLMEDDSQLQRTIGYDGQSQRSIGYDQRSLNGRSLGPGFNPVGLFGPGSGSGTSTGVGADGLPLSRTNTNNTRTLEDVVQEMKEAAWGKGIGSRSPNYSNSGVSVGGPAGTGVVAAAGVGMGIGNSGILPLTRVTSTDPSERSGSAFAGLGAGDGISIDGGSRPSSYSSSINSNQPHSSYRDYKDPGLIESLRESHPASQGLNIRPSDITSNHSGSGASAQSGTSSTLQPPPAVYHQNQQLQQNTGQSPSLPSSRLLQPFQSQGHDHPARGRVPSVSKFHEVEREEDNGVIRTAVHEIDDKDRALVEKALQEKANERRHSDQEHVHPHDLVEQPYDTKGPTLEGPTNGGSGGNGNGGEGGGRKGTLRTDSMNSTASSGHRHLGDLFKTIKKEFGSS
ncbi:sodium/hydrogen antiporter [Entomortierella parvispora]|uniref:Sodium/hydrogen antiporter n=1 Tax=Entomortierella parvispora TaxID=205924 RepID=A0A9P3LTR4_9FUNG|nr:sodium/hydrogen antiporter [Entomortierella parvispora]